ncbi:hypothetical protein [Castellaniella sp.]|uniref:hypothetical protein n=1 Tax=Castellaniella sp. TaxID=1955812 RepID=UPI002AFE1295|nr:hypothetical protein [Castellaniella sp.]
MAKDAGLPPDFVVAILNQESGFDPRRRPVGKDGKALSSAFGIGQLLVDERRKYGIGDTTDPDLQLRATMSKMKDNHEAARKALGREPTAGEMYVVYYQGIGAGPRILSNPGGDFRATLDTIKPGWGATVIKANPWLKDIRTNADFIAWTEKKMAKTLANAGASSVMVTGTRTGQHFTDTGLPFAPAGSPEAQAQSAAHVAWKPDPTFWQTVEAAADESTSAYIFRQSPVFSPDDSYQPTSDELEARKEGLPEKYHDSLLGVSRAHSDYLTSQAKRQYENEKLISEAGWMGIGVSLAAGMLDPTDIAIGLASGGMGALAGGAMKLGRLGQMATAGVGAAAGNVALTGAAEAGGKITEGSDYAYAAAWGLGLGFAFGPLARNPATQDIAAQGTMAANRAMAQASGRAAPAGQSGNLSAASNPNLSFEFSKGDLAGMDGTAVPKTAVQQLRPDMAGRIGSSPNPVARAVGAIFGLDTVGKVGPNGERVVNPHTVGEDHAAIRAHHNQQVYSVARPQFQEWAKANGYAHRWQRQEGTGEAWGRFGEEVSRFIRDRGSDASTRYAPQVVATGKALRQAFSEHLDGNVRPRAETPGNPGRALAGLESVPWNPWYLPRKWRSDKILSQEGGRKFREWLEGSLLAAHPELGDKAFTIANGMTKNIVGRAFGIDEFMMMSRNGATADVIRTGLKDIGVDDVDIEDILSRLPKGSKVDFTHYKLDLDEGFVLKGQHRLEDFAETQALELFDHYNHQASAWRALGRAQIVDKDGNKLLDGIRSVQEFEKVIAEVKARGYEAGQTPKQIADDVAIIQEMFDRIRGVPHAMAGTSLDQSMEIARNAATAIFGGSFGLSALMDIGRLSSLAGVKAMLQHMPAFRREIVEGGVLKPGSPLVRDLQAAFAYVEEFRPLSPRFDPADGRLTGRMEGAMGKATDTSRVVADAVVRLSGMPAINRRIREAASGIMAQRFYKDLKKAVGAGGSIDLSRLKPVELERMKWFGMDDDMLSRVLGQLRDHASSKTGFLGEKITGFNPGAWTDLEALNAFSTAIRRGAARATGEFDVGAGTVWDRSPVFRSFIQLRRFTLNAWHANILHGYHMKDGEAFADVAASMFMAGTVYAARTRLKAAYQEDPDAYMEENLSPQAIAMAAFQLSAYSSFIPTAIDSLAMSAIGADPVFGFRNSGLPSDALFGNPTFAMFDAVSKAPAGLTAPLATGRERSQQEWKQMAAIVPFANNFAVQAGLGAMVVDAPRKPPKDGSFNISDTLFGDN